MHDRRVCIFEIDFTFHRFSVQVVFCYAVLKLSKTRVSFSAVVPRAPGGVSSQPHPRSVQFQSSSVYGSVICVTANGLSVTSAVALRVLSPSVSDATMDRCPDAGVVMVIVHVADPLNSVVAVKLLSFLI